MPNELTEQKNESLIPQDDDGGEALGNMIRTIISPMVEAMALFMRNNTEALERIAATQKIQTDRMEALERQIRLNTPITRQQEKYLGDAIRAKARELLFKREVEDEKATRKLTGSIKKSVLARYGVTTMREIPKHEYSGAMDQISMWNDAMCVRDAIREARKRSEKNLEGAGPAAEMDASAFSSGPDD